MSMYPRATLKALNSAIQHWQRLAYGTARPGEDIGGSHCALCSRFDNDCEREDPAGNTLEVCPVRLATDQYDCIDTPYYDAHAARHDYGLDSPRFREAAFEEMEFLTGLLPARVPVPTHEPNK